MFTYFCKIIRTYNYLNEFVKANQIIVNILNQLTHRYNIK